MQLLGKLKLSWQAEHKVSWVLALNKADSWVWIHFALYVQLL